MSVSNSSCHMQTFIWSKSRFFLFFSFRFSFFAFRFSFFFLFFVFFLVFFFFFFFFFFLGGGGCFFFFAFRFSIIGLCHVVTVICVYEECLSE